MTDILLGNAYFMRFDKAIWRAMQPYPPLGTLYATSYTRQHGYDVALFDATLAETTWEWGALLDRHQPKYAVLYEDHFNYLSKMCLLDVRQAALEMIGMAKQRGITTIVSSADATDHPDIYLGNGSTPGADYILLGEGEITLLELLTYLDQADQPTTQGLTQIQGLAFASNLGGVGMPDIVRSPRRPDISDLDNLPFPAWDLVNTGQYRQIWLERHGYYSVNMVTTRGCPFHCNWCAKPIWGQRYHMRSPENVIQEMAWLQEHVQPDHIWFADDIFGLPARQAGQSWLARFASQLEETPQHRIPFKCLSRADLLTRPGEVEALSRAGCQIVWIGAESGSQLILDAMEKGTRIDQIEVSARSLQDADIRVAFFLQFGYPGETRAHINETIKLVHRLMPDDIGISVSYPLPGTRFYERVQDQLGAVQNWQHSSDLPMLYQGPFTTSFYRQLHRVVHRGYQVRKIWRMLKAWLRKPVPPAPNQGRAWLRMVYWIAWLPFDHLKLEILARQQHQGAAYLPPELTQLEAASISPQTAQEDG